MLNFKKTDLVDTIMLDDGSIELWFESSNENIEGLMTIKLYFADSDLAEKYIDSLKP